MTSAASDGPRMRVRLLTMLIDATASGSSSSGTISPTTALIAGWVSAVAMPPERGEEEQERDGLLAGRDQDAERDRRRRRRARCRARRCGGAAAGRRARRRSGESSRNGRNCATRLSDTANGQPLSSRIAHPSATYWPQVPSCDTPLPSCTSAKSRWRRTRIERGRRDRMATMWRSCWPDAQPRRQMSVSRDVVRTRTRDREG